MWKIKMHLFIGCDVDLNTSNHRTEPVQRGRSRRCAAESQLKERLLEAEEEIKKLSWSVNEGNLGSSFSTVSLQPIGRMPLLLRISIVRGAPRQRKRQAAAKKAASSGRTTLTVVNEAAIWLTVKRTGHRAYQRNSGSPV
ncbi:hypothetical protein C4D60_Mb03t06440 [Musa balbisiana]|uniref:Uncharacterized protein n=1 Tax=Musa balbisiana TaxID=52838 RepID=A0A4S8J7Y8_MUSBA|nr:hypothetical protein C4D60_Mb03t06440 [Musa balbisiana]